MMSTMITANTVTLYIVSRIMHLIINVVLVVFKMTSEGGDSTMTTW